MIDGRFAKVFTPFPFGGLTERLWASFRSIEGLDWPSAMVFGRNDICDSCDDGYEHGIPSRSRFLFVSAHSVGLDEDCCGDAVGLALFRAEPGDV